MANFISFTDEKDSFDTILELRVDNGVLISIDMSSHPGSYINLSDEDAKELVNRINEYLLNNSK